MNSHDINRWNIDNLTSLWKKMGVSNQPGLSVPGLLCSVTWPHRCWFDSEISSESLTEFKNKLNLLPAHAVVPVWDFGSVNISSFEENLIGSGFSILFSQLAMYLNLHEVSATKSKPDNIYRVQSAAIVPLWVDTASKAFGYSIDSAAIEPLIHEDAVHLLLMKIDHQAVGTALVYKTGDVIGVHLVGVPAEYRGKGIARAIMNYVIQLSIEIEGRYLTLQASSAGEPLYRSLGFNKQFLIKNYRR